MLTTLQNVTLQKLEEKLASAEGPEVTVSKRDLSWLIVNARALDGLLCRVNGVTAFVRHGNKVPHEKLINLCNYQIEVEKAQCQQSTSRPREWDPRIVEACKATLRSYDLLIEDPKGARPLWENYGDACHVCNVVYKVMGVTDTTTCEQDCWLCPLALDGNHSTCVDKSAAGNEGTFDRLFRAITECDGPADLVRAATARKEFLIQRLKNNGVDIDGQA